MKIIINKFLTYLVYVSFIICPFHSLMASDYISVEKVNELISAQLKEQKSLSHFYRQEISKALTNVDPNEGMSLLAFIFYCRTNHFMLTNYSQRQADFDFFESELSFLDYVGTDWKSDEELQGHWFFYYMEAARFFVENDIFTEAQKYFLKADEINPTLMRSMLASLFASAYQNNFDSDSKDLFYSYALMYENIRKAQKICELDVIDFILLGSFYNYASQNEKSLEFLLKALKMPWPSDDHLFYKVRVTQDEVKQQIAKVYYKSKQYDKSLALYSELNSPIFGVNDHKNICFMLANKKLYQLSFEHYEKIDSFLRTGQPVDFSPEEALMTVDMLLQRPQKQFKKYSKVFIKALRRAYPSIENDLNALLTSFKNLREKKYNAIIRSAIAQQAINDIGKSFNTFDLQCGFLWARSSVLPANLTNNLLHPLQDLAQKIVLEFGQLRECESLGSNTDIMEKIMSLTQSLRDNFASFTRLANEIDHQICKSRRNFYRQNSGVLMPEKDNISSSSILSSGTSKSLKSQIILEQRLVQEKAELVKAKKACRKEKEKIPVPKKDWHQEKDSPKAPVQSSLCSFKNSTLEHLWQSQELPENILGILNTLQSAQSIFHLRSLLCPGTRLEILKGDRRGQISLRINDQFRLCFYWVTGQGAYEIEMLDYH